MAEPISPQSLHHISLATKDAETAARFYETVIGMKRISRPEFSFGGAWLYHPQGDWQIHLIEREDVNDLPESIDAQAPHFAMEVEDLEVVEVRLKEHAIAYKRKFNSAGFEQIFFHDPDGNMIEIGIYPASRSGADA
ncbi:MAG: VOC family protein [Pirellulales bacterium]|jgi:catechol 2,3-dioxygenase-like lactoylglutathione lyase family enzyme|nr:VOC family protein [Pirellulales bacterium]HJN67313.1 VOC family protein [Pirellulales bacterium]